MDRRRVVVQTPRFGWELPWPNAFEVAELLPSDRWTLIGGLMVQVHAVAHQITTTRPTVDLDMLLHIEVLTGVTSEVADKLAVLGYNLEPPRRRNGPAYRFTRGRDHIDVMAADHAAPAILPLLGSFPMFKVEGGTQALRRTMIYELERPGRHAVDFSVPDELGALVLKGAAYITDSRDRDRHLFDAAVLAACITDHAGERERLGGNDRTRIRHLAEQLEDPQHPAWRPLSSHHQQLGQDTLRILSAEPRRRRPASEAAQGEA